MNVFNREIRKYENDFFLCFYFQIILISIHQTGNLGILKIFKLEIKRGNEKKSCVKSF